MNEFYWSYLLPSEIMLRNINLIFFIKSCLDAWLWIEYKIFLVKSSLDELFWLSTF